MRTPPPEVIAAAHLVREWVLDDIAAAASPPREEESYLFARPAALADQLGFFLDVFRRPPTTAGSDDPTVKLPTPGGKA